MLVAAGEGTRQPQINSSQPRESPLAEAIGISTTRLKSLLGTAWLRHASSWSFGGAMRCGESSLAAVRAYLRHQLERNPKEVIAGWEGDAPEYDLAGR